MSITFNTWKTKKDKISINDFIQCDFIPTRIGFVAEILPKNIYVIGTLFKDYKDSEAKIHYHTINKKDLKPINRFLPLYVAETYKKYYQLS